MPKRVRTADGVEIAVHELGGDGPPLLLAHATGLHGLVFRPLADRLARRFRCVSPDLRGHGDSQRPPDGDFAWQGFARDVLAVVDGLDLDRPVGMGHSAGGAVLLLAEQARPGTFAALYCFEPVVIPADPPLGRDRHNPLADAARRRRREFPSRRHAYDNYASKPPLEVLDPAALRAYVEYGFADLAGGGVGLKCRPEDEAAIFELGSAHPAYGSLDTVGCPVMVACGADTEAFGPAVAAQQAAPLPQGRTEVLPGVGHFGPLEDPASVAASICRFVDGPRAGRGRVGTQPG